MPLAEHEQISVRVVHILRTDIHLVKIQFHQNLHHAHISADMSRLPCTDHVDRIFSELISQRF